MASLILPGYVLFLIMLVSLVGLGLECVLLHALYRRRFHNLKWWYLVTGCAFLLSIALAVNFILGILEIPSRPQTGKNFVQVRSSLGRAMGSRKKDIRSFKGSETMSEQGTSTIQ